MRKVVMASLSNLSKWLGVYEEWKGVVKRYGLKWSSGRTEELIIERMANVQSGGDVLDWVRLVKRRVPKLTVFLDFMVYSGLRLREAVNSWNLIIQLSREYRLGEYYNDKSEALEHYRFKGLFIRRSKKVFVSFVPEWLIRKISEQQPLTLYQVNNFVRRDNRLKARFCDIREHWATFMTRWLSPAEIDFLQGRVGASVFMRNYFNPALLGDLKARVFMGIEAISEQLEKE
ncbi:hypothetical protein KEJ33_03375 [Candidatus Bathyarchaeota archaeon]|nr:hypothetical protein [Candidatus Bathyarchaeota archaeon]